VKGWGGNSFRIPGAPNVSSKCKNIND